MTSNLKLPAFSRLLALADAALGRMAVDAAGLYRAGGFAGVTIGISAAVLLQLARRGAR